MRFISAEQLPDANDAPKGLEVVCCGLPRCATSSLQAAMQDHLGLGPTHHMASVMPYTSKIRQASAATNEPDKAKRQALLYEMFAGYRSLCDAPGCFFIDDILEMYPGVTLVLNKRKSAEAWEKSMSDTIARFFTKQFELCGWLIPQNVALVQYGKSWDTLLARRFGPGMQRYTVDTYNKHNTWVRQVAKEKGVELLEWTPDMGWEPICTYLGKPVPKEPFPHKNDTATMKALLLFFTVRGILSWVALFSAPLVTMYAVSRFL
ncbi:hypothetical protein MMC19_005240 [Ptychographa xylographoides]|nr:hypothetical protein [Ptychographa xylographoides]